MRKFWMHFKNALKKIIFTSGSIAIIMAMLAFTRIPYDINYWLGTHESDFTFEPDKIIFLGGSGMPSESNLIRLYYTAALTKQFTPAKIIICHPIDTTVINLMKLELISKGIDSSFIFFEKDGTNTRGQALKVIENFSGIENENVLIVTSPECMLRAVKTFRKAGFKNVGGKAAFENAMFIDLKYNHKKIGGKNFVPDVSNDLDLRYNFWNYLKLEITCLREFFALAYYKINAWI